MFPPSSVPLKVILPRSSPAAFAVAVLEKIIAGSFAKFEPVVSKVRVGFPFADAVILTSSLSNVRIPELVIVVPALAPVILPVSV